MIVRVWSAAIQLVDVSGMLGTSLVGLPDIAAQESCDQVKTALKTPEKTIPPSALSFITTYK
jgi:predicted ATPase with chaperone activity